MDMSVFSDAMRNMVGVLQYPVIIALLVFLCASLVLVGIALVEWCAERRRLHVEVPALMDELEAAPDAAQLRARIEGSGLLASQKAVLDELAVHPHLSDEQREAMAVELLEKEQAKYDLRLTWSNLIARLSPMFGLMGTLIPLGPGLIALGQGNTQILSSSLLIAFDTTVVGLVAAAFAVVVSTARKRWYAEYMSMLEALEQCVLEAVKRHARA